VSTLHDSVSEHSRGFRHQRTNQVLHGYRCPVLSLHREAMRVPRAWEQVMSSDIAAATGLPRGLASHFSRFLDDVGRLYASCILEGTQRLCWQWGAGGLKRRMSIVW
jgi:hypothetical protein